MNVLTVCPGLQSLQLAYFEAGSRQPAWRYRGSVQRADETYRASVARHLAAARQQLAADFGGRGAELIGVRVAHGGQLLDAPILAATGSLETLQAAALQAPLHVPSTVEVVHACRSVFANARSWLVPETAFFCRLPLREQLYGLDTATRKNLGVRRFGFHGLFHQAACSFVAAQHFRAGRRQPARILSVCLEPQPGLAAVRGRRPVMVTGGATPLEGLPGETTCGELDPGIVLALSRHCDLGPEQLDALLSRDSGLCALVNERISLGDLLRCPSRKVRLARDVFEHRVLLAAGAGIAALGGVDQIVFSGRYVLDGEGLASVLRERFSLALAGQPHQPSIRYFTDSLDRVLADATLAAAAADETRQSA